MNDKKKKGFTLVELLVVIAILGILAAVSVVGYLGFTEKAQESNDIGLVSTMNNILQADESINKKPTSPDEALEVLDSHGLSVKDLTPDLKGNFFAWDETSNRMNYLKSDFTVIYPENSSFNKNLWGYAYDQASTDKFIAKEGWGVCVVDNVFAPTEGYDISKLYGVVVAENNSISGDLKYTNSSLEAESKLLVKGTVYGTLEIDDNDAVVNHYGEIRNVILTNVAASSYHEFGRVVNDLKVKTGRLVLEDNSSVTKVVVKAGGTPKVEVNDTKEVVQIEGEQVNTVVDIKVNNTTSKIVVEKIAEESKPANATEIVEVTDEAGLLKAVRKTNVIKLANDIEITKPILVGNNGNPIKVVINGENHTINCAAKANRAIRIDSNNVDLKLVNLIIDGKKICERGVQVDMGCINTSLSIVNSKIINQTYYAINICNDADTKIEVVGSKIQGWGALNLWSAGYEVSIVDSELIGINDKAYNKDGWNNFAVVVLEGDTTNKTTSHSSLIDIRLVNTKIVAETLSENAQGCILFNEKSKGNNVVLDNCTLETGNSDYTYEWLDNGLNNKLYINKKLVNENI